MLPRGQFVQQLEAFCRHFNTEAVNAREIAAGPVESGDKPVSTGLAPTKKTIGVDLVASLAASAERWHRNDHGHLAAHQIGGQASQPVQRFSAQRYTTFRLWPST